MRRRGWRTRKPEGTERTAEAILRQRTDRQARRWQRKLERFRQVQRQIEAEAPDILKSRNFNRMKEYIQHGNVTVNAHVLNVARYSIAIRVCLVFLWWCRELIRGALLHDYFLYDWHIPDKEHPHKLHGFYHPGVALQNAVREYKLTEREQHIIRRHMWPLTVVPPVCREAWIVTTADKWCSLMETLHMHKGHGAVIPKLRDNHIETFNG